MNVKSSGKSVLFIGHNIYHVYDICDRFIILDRGEILHELNKSQVESPEKLIIAMKKYYKRLQLVRNLAATVVTDAQM